MLDPALSELAESCGIEPGYHDIWGVWHEASTDTVRALLSAMGVSQQAVRSPTAPPSEGVLPVTVVLRCSAQGLPVRLAVFNMGQVLSLRITDEKGQVHEQHAQIAGLRVIGRCQAEDPRRRTVLLPLPALPAGYHRLQLSMDGDSIASSWLILTPDRCYLPAGAARGQRSWGVVLQLYGLRSEHNWGIGDFGDLAEAVEQWSGRGAAFVGVNPLHALYLGNPCHASPYSPSSRLFLNPLYLNVEAIEEFAGCPAARKLRDSKAFADQLVLLRSSELVDYEGVAAAKKQVLELLYEQFVRSRAVRGRTRRAEFERFCIERGDALRRYGLFETLYEHFRRLDPSACSWQQWPELYRDPNSTEVAAFALENAHRIGYFLYLQWQSAVQLNEVQRRCRESGMEIGLYLDLAVSIDRGGADAWAHQDVYALSASVGAPPDDFNPTGQDWGLPPFNPPALQRTGYGLFIETLRANMAAGALRIDHVMGLARLFWVPPQGGSTQGAYVRYPLEDLLAIVALESERNRCMVIGEDLGTVPVQLRHALREWGVLSYRLLMFERDAKGRFQRSSEFPIQSMVAFSTHDLPTFVGYWRAQDAQTRQALMGALREAKLLPEGLSDSAQLDDEALGRLSHAVHLYLARSPALLLSVQIDDLAGAAEQANVPGTPDRAPNWRRKVAVTQEAMRADPRLRRLGEDLTEARATGPMPSA